MGAFVGWAFAGALVYFDFGGLGTLIFNSSQKWVAIALLAWFFPITFGSAAVATAVLLGHDFGEGDDETKGREPDRALHLAYTRPLKLKR